MNWKIGVQFPAEATIFVSRLALGLG